MTTLDTDRKRAIRKHADTLATERDRWIKCDSDYYAVPRAAGAGRCSTSFAAPVACSPP
jgi:hypothetical protein